MRGVRGVINLHQNQKSASDSAFRNCPFLFTYPEAESENFQHALQREEPRQSCVHILQGEPVAIGLLVVLLGSSGGNEEDVQIITA